MIHLVTRPDDEEGGALAELAAEPSVAPFPMRIRRAGNNNAIVEPPLRPETQGAVVVPLRKGQNAPGEELFEALLCADAIKRSTGRVVIALATYLDYARSDATTEDSGALGARAWSRLLETGSISGLVVPGWHSPALQSLFSIPTMSFDALSGLAEIAIRDIASCAWVIAPDLGRAATVARIASERGLRAGFLAKQALSHGARSTDDRGWPEDFEGAPVLVIDDEIDSGWTMARAVEWASARDAGPITLAATHCFSSARVLRELRASSGVGACLTTRLGAWPAATGAGWDIAEIAPSVVSAIKRLIRGGV